MDQHVRADALEAGLEDIRRSPADVGTIELIVRRPAEDEREVLDEGMLDLNDGLVGDAWRARGSSRMPDGSANPDAQLTLTNSRLIGLVARERERWALAGDQLYVDFDLSADNVPPGTRLGRRIGGDRSDRRAPYRLRQVQRPFRLRGAPLHQLARRQVAPPARHQHAGRRGRHACARETTVRKL